MTHWTEKRLKVLGGVPTLIVTEDWDEEHDGLATQPGHVYFQLRDVGPAVADTIVSRWNAPLDSTEG